MKRHNKTSLFLMELILSILLFSLCSAVCVQLFVSAYRTEQDAQALTWATMLCDSMAAQIKDSKDPDGLRPVCYDSDFLPCENSDDAAWLLTGGRKRGPHCRYGLPDQRLCQHAPV